MTIVVCYSWFNNHIVVKAMCGVACLYRPLCTGELGMRVMSHFSVNDLRLAYS